MRYFSALIITIIVLLAQPGASYYVAPYGTAAGDGSADIPKTLAWAMSSAPSGSTVWLIPGTYSGAWVANASGVTYRSEVGTRALLDGNLTIQAADTTFRDLEITNTSWTTRTGTTMPQANTYVGVFAPRVKILNSWIHDLGGGIYAFNGSGGASADLIVRGCLLYNNGWQDTSNPRSAHGHGVYTQNDPLGTKLYANNIILNNYALGIQAYGSSGPSAQLERMTFQGNISANNEWIIGGGRPLRDTHVVSNTLWASNLRVGYSNQANEDVEIRGNVLGLSRLQVQWVQRPTVVSNTITMFNDATTYTSYAGVITPTWDFNQYFRTDAVANFDTAGNFRTLAQWRALTGFDAHSTAAQGHALDRVLVQANQDDAQRATVVVENWSGAGTVNVTLPNLTAGANYRLVNAENPSQSLAFTAGTTVPIPTSGWTAATPYGAAAPFKGMTAPQFLTFLVEPS